MNNSRFFAKQKNQNIRKEMNALARSANCSATISYEIDQKTGRAVKTGLPNSKLLEVTRQGIELMLNKDSKLGRLYSTSKITNNELRKYVGVALVDTYGQGLVYDRKTKFYAIDNTHLSGSFTNYIENVIVNAISAGKSFAKNELV